MKPSFFPAGGLLLALAGWAAIDPPLPIFEDASESSGLRFEHFIGATGSYFVPEILGSGVALLDYDGDGDLDVYLLQGTMLEPGQPLARSLFPAPKEHFPGNRLFRNELVPTGKLQFTDVTGKAGVAGNGAYAMGVAVGDYDNDGRPDLFVTTYGPNLLLHNNGDGTFTDVTKEALPREPAFHASASFFDYDRDGFLDLFVTRYNAFTVEANKKCRGPDGAREYCGPGDYAPIPDRLYHNDGRGHFTDVTATAGIGAAFGNGLGVICADFDGDGWIDVFVANDKTPNQLWLNQHNGTFRDAALTSGTAYDADGNAHAGMGVSAADLNGDGREDLFVSNLMGETHVLYLNQGNGIFEDATNVYWLGSSTVPYTGFGTLWFDYDNDGLLDLFIANGEVRAIQSLRGRPFPYGQKNQLYHNDGKRFRDVSGAAGAPFEMVEVSRGAAFGDIDNDGDIDIVVTNANGPAHLLLNQSGSRNHWLEIRLEGGTVNRDAYGTRVALFRKGRPPLWRRVAADGSYLSSNDPRIHFGLGNDEELRSAPVEKLFIIWPEGTTESRPVPQADTILFLKEESAPKPGVKPRAPAVTGRTRS